jgi:dihydroorotate dehydrogenase (NAD+) catalytic subunit
MALDLDTMRPVLAGVTGGLSGAGDQAGSPSGASGRCMRRCPTRPIIGMGGVRTGLDALELILAGASAVSVGTAVFGDPTAPARVLRELREALVTRGFETVADAVGYAHERGPSDEQPACTDRGRPGRARPRDGAALGRGGSGGPHVSYRYE